MGDAGEEHAECIDGAECMIFQRQRVNPTLTDPSSSQCLSTHPFSLLDGGTPPNPRCGGVGGGVPPQPPPWPAAGSLTVSVRLRRLRPRRGNAWRHVKDKNAPPLSSFSFRQRVNAPPGELISARLRIVVNKRGKE